MKQTKKSLQELQQEKTREVETDAFRTIMEDCEYVCMCACDVGVSVRNGDGAHAFCVRLQMLEDPMSAQQCGHTSTP